MVIASAPRSSRYGHGGRARICNVAGRFSPRLHSPRRCHGLVAGGVAVASRAHASIDILDQIFNRASDRHRIGIGSRDLLNDEIQLNAQEADHYPRGGHRNGHRNGRQKGHEGLEVHYLWFLDCEYCQSLR